MLEGAVPRVRVAWIGVFLISTLMTISARTEAVDAQKEVKPFLESIKETAYELSFLRNGLESVHAVKFSDGMQNEYQPFFNRIVLQRTMDDGVGKIKRLKGLGGSDFGTLGHEAFHAFKANYIETEDKYSAWKYFLSRRASNLYRSVPEDKRAVTLEEAYASFIGWMLQAHHSTQQSFKRITPENCEVTLRNLERIWGATWKSHVSGYWYKDSVSEYWQEQFSGLGILFSKGRKAYKDWQNQEKVQMVEEDLADLDRNWVGYNIFEGTISSDFKETFKKELEAVKCE